MSNLRRFVNLPFNVCSNCRWCYGNGLINRTKTRTFVSKTKASWNDTSNDKAEHHDISPQPDTSLYEGHIPTTRFQKTLLSVGSAAMALTRPWRGDMVATFGETSGHYALTHIQKKMSEDPVGQQILMEKPRINTKTVNMQQLRYLPEGTLGKNYVTWLDKNRASPDERLPVQYVDDAELAYVMTRYREVHDLLHTVLGMPTNMLGEVVVKWVEALQTGLPMCALAALGGPVRFGPKGRQTYMESHLWWAIRNGRNSKFFMNFYYEHHWDMPISQIREKLNIEEPPNTPERSWKSS